MMRGTTVLLVILASLGFGHAPCCVFPTTCCERAAPADEGTPAVEATTHSCCGHCGKAGHASAGSPAAAKPADGKPRLCKCPKIAGLLVLAAPADHAPAALPELAVPLPVAVAREAVPADTRPARSPPRPAQSLPLLL